MAWHPPDCVSHLLRDKLRLEVTCKCGHVAYPDLLALRSALWAKRRNDESLMGIERMLSCSKCGARNPFCNVVDRAE